MTEPAAQPEDASLRARLALAQEGFWALAEWVSEPMETPLPAHIQRAVQPARILAATSAVLGGFSLLWMCLSGRIWVGATLMLTSLIGGVLGLALIRAISATRPSHIWQPLNPVDLHPRPSKGLLSWGDEGLFYIERPGRHLGLSVGTRMAILRPEDTEDLLVYAPVDLPVPMIRALHQLGAIRWVVFPTRQEAERPPDWVNHLEEADLWCPDRWKSGASPEWPEGFVEAQTLSDEPSMQELILYHPRSSTLIVKSAILNLGHDPDRPLLERGSLHLLAMARRPGPALPRKWRTRHDPSLSSEVTRVASWSFERVFLAHGPLIDHQGKQVWNEAYAFVNPTEPRSQDAA